MSHDDGRVIDPMETTPRVLPAPEPAGASYVRLAVFAAAVFAVIAVGSALPDRAAAQVERWLAVLAVAALLLALARFFRVAWQFRSDDKIPLLLAGLVGVFAAWRLGNVLNGRDPNVYLGRGLRVRVAGAPFRWLGYSTGDTLALTFLAVGLALAALWLLASVKHYLKQKNKTAAMVVAAASVALSGCVWLLVN